MALYGGPPRYVPGHYGQTDSGYQQWEKSHWAGKGGRWTKAPKRPVRPTAPTRQRVFDPLAPTSDAELRQRALGLSQESLAPLLDQIRRVFAERSNQGQSAIRGTTQALGNLFAQAAPQTAAAYAPAIQQSGAVNTELANRLNSFGQNLGGELQGKLALQDAGAPLTQQIAGGAQQTAQGVSNANFASGAADTQRLIAESAHGQEYGAKLPGIAALTGMQHAKQLEAQLNHDLADQLANASDKASSTFVDLYQNLVNQEWQKTLARTSGQFNSEKEAQRARDRAQLLAFRKVAKRWDIGQKERDRREKAREANQRASTSRQGQNQTQAGQNLRQNRWQVNPDGSFKLRRNRLTGKMERIPIKPPKKSGTSNSGL